MRAYWEDHNLSRVAIEGLDKAFYPLNENSAVANYFMFTPNLNACSITPR